MKKITAILLSTVIMLTFMLPAGAIFFGKEPTVTDKTLRFSEDGKFTVLQISDIQDCLLFRDMTKQFIIHLLDTVKPDLVVLTGDNIGPNTCFTKGMTKLTFDCFMNIFEERGVKVASVFGNHDADRNSLNKDEQLELYNMYSCYIGGDVAELSGAGTYRLPVLASDSDKTAFNLWFFDSGADNDENDLGGYGCVHKDQIDWYINEEKALTEGNGGVPVPSMAFQHIIVPEVYDVLEKTDKPEEEAANGKLVAEYKGNFYVFPEKYVDEETYFSETPCPPFYSNGQADALVDTGKVLGIVSGHDHKNSFVIPYKTLDIIQTPAAGFGAYGDENRGARIITLDENDLSDYETDVIFYRDIFDMTDEKVYNRYLLNNAGGNGDIPKVIKYGIKFIIDKIF